MAGRITLLSGRDICLVATSDDTGACDVSPKGDPPGHLAYVIDDTTIALAERPGNRRADGYKNILSNPHVGLIFLIPGRGDTLRINGRARLISDAPYFDDMIVKGHRPILALVIEIDEVFHHCSKAFLRSQLWRPETWTDPVPPRPVIAKAFERPEQTLEQLNTYYGEGYANNLY
jgi:PPOX class probable FMN-dependent enzyme